MQDAPFLKIDMIYEECGIDMQDPDSEDDKAASQGHNNEA
jgi:hypothetical protein